MFYQFLQICFAISRKRHKAYRMRMTMCHTVFTIFQNIATYSDKNDQWNTRKLNYANLQLENAKLLMYQKLQPLALCFKDFLFEKNQSKSAKGHTVYTCAED